MNNDQHGRNTWGSAAYDAIPKSVFALVAWHLADIASADGIGHGGGPARFRQEVEALVANGFLDRAQASRVLAKLPA